MKPKHAFIKVVLSFVFLSFVLGMSGEVPVLAMHTSPENSPPAGLTAGDWSQILDLIRGGSLPVQQAYLKASNTGTNDWFGYSVAISGDTVVVGARNESSNATGVDGNQWDNSAVEAGAAYVFVRSGTTWSQQAYLKASNTDAGDNFGESVAISGDTVVIGAYWESSNATGVNGNQADNSASMSGAVYVFTRSGATWSQQAYLKASNTGSEDHFGKSVAICGDTVVVGAEWESSNAIGVDGDQNNDSAFRSGAAYVFIRSETTWSQQAYLKASNTGAEDRFGRSIAVDGNTVVVGAYNEDSNAIGVNGNQNDESASSAGAAYVFTRSETIWSQQAYLKASNTEAYDFFSASVDISGDTVVVGAYGEDSSTTGVNGNQGENLAPQSGAAYVFIRSGTTWSQQAYLKASNTGGDDYFAFSVAISGDTILVGAYYEDSNATGVNGNQWNNSAENAGAAYVFTSTGTTWSQQAYLKASNTMFYDWYGYMVGIDGEVMIIGALYEDSNATGVNGNQSDNSAQESGAAYIYTLKHTTILRSTAAYDGHILESGETTNLGGSMDSASTTLRLGDDPLKKQYRSILSFATGNLPDNTVITKVTLKVRRQGVTGGGNPVATFQGFMLDIRKGSFGTAALQVTDWQAAASKTIGPYQPALVSGWYSFDLTGAKAYINKLATGSGLTQIRLRFKLDDNNNTVANYLSLYSGNAGAAYRPTLVIEYYIP